MTKAQTMPKAPETDLQADLEDLQAAHAALKREAKRLSEAVAALVPFPKEILGHLHAAGAVLNALDTFLALPGLEPDSPVQGLLRVLWRSLRTMRDLTEKNVWAPMPTGLLTDDGTDAAFGAESEIPSFPSEQEEE